MANLNLLFLGVLVVAAGGSIGLVLVLLMQQELQVHRRPWVMIAFVLGFTAFSILLAGGLSGLAVCLAAAICFFAVGLVFRTVPLGNNALLPADRLPRPRRIRRWRLNGIEIAKLAAFLVFLTVVVLAARRNYQAHLQEQEFGPSYLELIENIASDID